DTKPDAPQSDGKATGGLKPATAMLAAADAAPAEHPHFIQSLALRFAETAIFLLAVVGAIALGLGITAYFAEHSYVLAYLAAYAGFCFSDLIVRGNDEDRPAHEELNRRIAAQLPLLAMFAAAPFERIYGAPVTAVLTLIIGAIFAQRRMKSEEAAMRARFGEEYEAYRRETDALIPAIW